MARPVNKENLQSLADTIVWAAETYGGAAASTAIVPDQYETIQEAIDAITDPGEENAPIWCGGDIKVVESPWYEDGIIIPHRSIKLDIPGVLAATQNNVDVITFEDFDDGTICNWGYCRVRPIVHAGAVVSDGHTGCRGVVIVDCNLPEFKGHVLGESGGAFDKAIYVYNTVGGKFVEMANIDARIDYATVSLDIDSERGDAGYNSMDHCDIKLRSNLRASADIGLRTDRCHFNAGKIFSHIWCPASVTTGTCYDISGDIGRLDAYLSMETFSSTPVNRIGIKFDSGGSYTYSNIMYNVSQNTESWWTKVISGNVLIYNLREKGNLFGEPHGYSNIDPPNYNLAYASGSTFIYKDHSATRLDRVQYGESVVAGNVVYRKSDGKYWETDADAIATMPGIGIALASVAADGWGPMATGAGNYVRDDSWSWTVGALLYVSTTKAELTETPVVGNNDVSQPFAVAINATHIMLLPSLSMVELDV